MGSAWLRSLPLLAFLLVCVGCRVGGPAQPAFEVTIDAELRAEAEADAQLEGEGELEAEAEIETSPARPSSPRSEFYGIPLDGAEDIVFVLDRSGSMNSLAHDPVGQADAPEGASAPPSAIEVAHEQLVDALTRLPAGARVNVIFFNHRVEAFAPSLIPMEEQDRDDFIEFVREMSATGATALAPAMRTAFLMHPRRVVLLSDGLGNRGGTSRDVMRDAREAMRAGVRIDAIGLGEGHDAELLEALARESGGLYRSF